MAEINLSLQEGVNPINVYWLVEGMRDYVAEHPKLEAGRTDPHVESIKQLVKIIGPTFDKYRPVLSSLEVTLETDSL
jgi:hypothetical protein